MRFSDTPACNGINVEIFFAEEKGNYPHLNYIKKICNVCPIQIECYDYSIKHLVHGIWAGTTKDERDKYRSKHGIIGETIVPANIFKNVY